MLIPRGETDEVVTNGVGDSFIEDDAPDNFVADAMSRAYDPDTNTVRDIRIDDSRLKLAKNFFDFCFNIVGEAVKPPFARQMWMAYSLLAEYCPKCTKPFWYEDIHNIPVDMLTKDLRKKVAFLEYGVCPYCEATKGELIDEGLLNDKTELIMIAGQRSGKSTITCMIAAYVLHVFLKSPKLSKICSGIQDFTPLTGTFTATTAGQAIKTLWNPYKKIITASSWFCLAAGTDVLMSDGSSKKIESVSVNDEVRTSANPARRVTKVFDNGVKECFELTLHNGNSLKGTEDHKVQCLGEDGTTLVWKRIGDLSADDFVLTT